MSGTNIAYKTTNFEYPNLTKISGQPNYELLKSIKDELKANAASVASNLGGGANGHLGLVLTDVEYLTVSPTAYIRPAHPGPLVIPAGPPAIPQYLRAEMREDHKEAVRVFREADNVEKALKKQFAEAMPELYLKRFRNRLTNTLTDSIPDILNYLVQTYGDISDTELSETETNLKDKLFDITQPIIVMYNEIQDLQDLAIAATNAYSDKQLVAIGIQLIKNMNDFEKGLTDWYARPSVDHTFINFKTHFEQAYLSLRKCRGISMKNTMFHQQANSVTERVLQEIKIENNTLRNDLKATEAKLFGVFENLTEVQKEDEENIPPEPTANSASENTIQLEILKTLAEIQKGLKKQQISKQPYKRKHPKKEHKDGQKKKWRYNTSKYCWTCGAGNHSSKDCRGKADGHQDNATFKTKMSGSTEFCQITE